MKNLMKLAASILTLLPALAFADATPLGSGGQIVPRTTAPTKRTANGSIYIKSNDSNKLHYVKPDGTDAEVGGGGGGSGDMLLGTSQTVTAAKTFNVGTLKLNNAGGTFATTLATAAAAARTWTLPDASDTAVGLATADTLTNKTLTAPVLGSSITGTYTLAGTPTLGANLSIGSGFDLIAAGGASDIDYSSSSGVFKTPTGASTQASSSYSFNAAYTSARGWSLVRYAAVNGVSTGGASLTTGIKFQWMQPVTVTGVRGRWVGGFGALTWKCSLFTGGSNVATANVSIDAAGTYEATFASPYNIPATELYKNYFVGCFTADAHYTYVATTTSRPSTAAPTQPFVANDWVMVMDNTFYKTSDAEPDTSAGSGQYFPVEPIFTAP